MKQFQGSDLEGDYTNTIVENSSRPKTIDEKQGQFAMLVKGGLIDPTDPSTREYVLDEMNLDRVNLTDHLQYEKAERDLESVINGQMPALNPFINLAIFMKIFSNFTLTEEFEEVPQDAQQRVMQATQLIGQQMAQQQAQAEMQQMRMQATQKLAGAMAEHAAQPPAGPSGLNGVPGKTTSPEASSSAAESEGNQMASAMP
jgi:type IV secretory pathway VirB6-like protein